jgi:hypothetical protein
MKTVIRLATFCLALAALRSFAADVELSPASRNPTINEPGSTLSYEFDVEGTYIGEGDLSRGSLSLNNFDEVTVKSQFVLTPRIKFGILRLGVQTERQWFSYGSNAAMPNTLQSTNLVIGLDTQLSESILIRIETQPGFYGTDWDSWGQDTFNVPALIGGTYIFNSGFQVFFGVGIDAFRQYPVLPGGGVRWKFAPQWTLNAVAPTPRLEYQMNSSFMMYLGGDFRSTSYRVGEQFGTDRGNTALNHAAITSNEIRAGGGLEWKITPEIKLTAEAGFIPWRNLDFHRVDIRYHQDGGVPYGMLAFHAAF